MAKELRRKPNRKSIIKADGRKTLRSHDDDEDSFSRERKSTNFKRTVSAQADKATLRGTVVGSAGNSWFVVRDELKNQTIGEFTNTDDCIVGGLIISDNDDGTLVCVGDRVRYTPADSEHSRGVIIEVEQRTTKIARKVAGTRQSAQILAGNIDKVFIVHSAAEPFYSKRSIDRYLISAEQGKIQPIIVINKIELMDMDFLHEDLKVYEHYLGIPVVYVSCFKKTGFDNLQKHFEGCTSVLVGPSGVGKSSIVNICFGIELQTTGEISEKYQKGKHTTTTGKLLGLPNGGSLIDTPGLREFGITDIHPDDVAFYFHDFDEYYHHCKYTSCTHTHEPNCAVKSAVEQGEIDPDRYDSYLRIRESIL